MNKWGLVSMNWTWDSIYKRLFLSSYKLKSIIIINIKLLIKFIIISIRQTTNLCNSSFHNLLFCFLSFFKGFCCVVSLFKALFFQKDKRMEKAICVDRLLEFLNCILLHFYDSYLVIVKPFFLCNLFILKKANF